jgi:hypothetical protein
MGRFLRRWAAGACALAVCAFGAPAGATGVTRVQQSDGSVQVYRNVRIRLVGETLWLTSPDRRGALEIADGACSFSGELQRCLPYAVTLHQHGQNHVIALDRGTVYVNLTGKPQSLRRSSQQLPPHNVLVALHTARGTYVSVSGVLDEVKP